jgi:predicted AAA+ superfamily ATPase
VKKRLIYSKILDQQDSRKASIIIGPRQVGKTTILKELHRQIGGLFFDIDIFTDYEQVSTYEKFIASLKINGYRPEQAKRFFVFLDEFQRYPDLSRVIKSIYDHHKNIKIYATGSSSLEIKNSAQESLAGRKIITHVYPLDFGEFLFF